MTSTPELTLAATEADFLRAVLDLAHLRGWASYHARPARTLDGWRTPGTGTMAKGWPDLVLVRVRGDDRRCIFAELKSEKGRTTPEQAAVRDLLWQLDWHHWNRDDARWVLPRVEVHVWRPRDWDAIEDTLR